MNTEELIRRLSSEVSPVSRRALEKRLLLGLTAGLAASAVILPAWLGVRADIDMTLFSAPFLIKMAYTASLAAAGLAACFHLMRPDGKPVRWFALMLVPVILLGLLAANELAQTPRDDWASLILGNGVAACLIRISIIAVPIFVGLFWAARKFAPTHLRAAGAAVGFSSGSLAAALYALHCIEMSACFIFLWYSLAIFGAAGLGAVIAPRVLRW